MILTAAILFVAALRSEIEPQTDDSVKGTSGGTQTENTRQTLQTRYARIQIDEKGFMTSLSSLQSGKEYSPAGHPPPLLSLHESDQANDALLAPPSARFRAESRVIELQYSNGAIAAVKAEGKNTYCRFQLVSLAPLGKVDSLVWGPLQTTVSNLIGDLIRVVRTDDWAVGMPGLEENTIAGPVTDGDCYGVAFRKERGAWEITADRLFVIE